MRQAGNKAAHEMRQSNLRRATRQAGWLLIFGMACVALAQKPPAPPPARMAKTVQQVDAQGLALLDDAVKALGGPAFLQFKTMSSRGRIFTISEGDTSGFAPFQSKMLYPDQRRFSYGKDKPVILINNGNRGWEMDRYGTIRQEPERVQRWEIANRYSMVNLLRVVAREKGTLVLTGGVDFVDLRPVRVLEIVDARHVDVKLYLERSTYLPVRVAYRTREKPDQDWTDVAEDYSDYQVIQGIQTPMHLTRYEDGSRVLEVFLASASYNQDYPASTFLPQ
jgi:hypothetical protein